VHMIEKFQKLLTGWANLHPLLRFFLGIILLISLIWGVGKPLYRGAKSLWYGHQLVKAEKAAEAGDMQQAKDLSQTVLRAKDERVIEALRVLERSMSALSDPNRIQIANALMFHPKGGQTDKLRGFLLNVDGSALGWLGQIWAHMDKENQTDRRFAIPFAERLLANKKLKEVLAVIQALDGWDKDWQTQSIILRTLIADDQLGSITQAQQKLEEWWPEGQHESALDIWESIPILKLNVELMPKSIERLNPDVARDALMLSRLKYVSDKWTRLEVVDQAIMQWRELAPKNLAQFLYDSGMNYRLFSTFPPEMSKKHKGMIRLQLQACAKENEWSKALLYLTAAEAEMEKIIFWGWKAAIADQVNHKDDLEIALSTINTEALISSDVNIYLKLSKLMGQAGLPDRVNQYMLEAIKTGKGALPLFSDITGLVQSVYEQGLEKSILEVISTYLIFEPSNPLLVTHYCYLSCVAGTCDPGVLLEAMKPLASAFSGTPQIHAVVTAIHLAARDYSAAKMQAELVKDDRLMSLAPGHRAAVAVARLKAGVIKPDAALIQDLPWSKIMAVESRFYRNLLDVETDLKEKILKE
jgi:hypothetical protein